MGGGVEGGGCQHGERGGDARRTCVPEDRGAPGACSSAF